MDNSSLAYSEVCTILNMLEDEYKERISSKEDNVLSKTIEHN